MCKEIRLVFLLDCGSADLCFLLHTLPVRPKLSVTSQKKEACDVQNGVGWGEVEVMAAKRILELILEKKSPNTKTGLCITSSGGHPHPDQQLRPRGDLPQPHSANGAAKT